MRTAPRSRVSFGVELRIGADRFYSGDQFYGAFQEFGWTVGKRRRRGPTARKIPGKHFLKRAYDTGGPAAAATALNVIWNEIVALSTKHRGGE